MVDRATYGWAAVILGAALAAALAAMVRAGALGAAPAALAVGAATGIAVLSSALPMYGARGALGALALTAWSPALMGWNGTVRPAVAALGQLVVVHVLMRCAFDPTLQWSLAAGGAIAAAALAASALGQSPAASGVSLAAFSLLLIAVRTATAEPAERRGRVLHAACAATALAWSIAGAIWYLAASYASLPSPQDFTARDAAVHRAAFAAIDAGGAAPESLPTGTAVAAVVLAVLRPWRRQRRYADATWLLALAVLALPLWSAARPLPGAIALLMPPLAVLAGACWDAWRPKYAQRCAAVLVIAQIAIVLARLPARTDAVPSDAATAAAVRSADGR
jgi:hypothetical protein